MKNSVRILTIVTGSMLTSIAAIITFLHTQNKPSTPQEILTLANIEALSEVREAGAVVNGPGKERYCSQHMTYHTYCQGRNDKACYHTGH